MDKGKGRGHGETSDPDDHSNRNKVTPAVADEAFLAEEDQDHNELHGNIDIGPGFLQPLPINKASGVKSKEVERKKPPPPPPRPRPFLSVQNAGGVSLPGTSGTGQKQPFDSAGRGRTSFFVGGLHWWTTDADVFNEVCKYGKVRDFETFLFRDCGKSRGYCKVEVYDHLVAAACMEGLAGHKFNGRPCVVSWYWTPLLSGNQPKVDNQGKKEPNEVEATKPGDGSNQGGNGDSRGYGRGNWGRGNNLGNGNRGHGNPVRNWGGGMGGRSIGMGGSKGRMGGNAGFPGGPIPPLPGNLPSKPGVGLHGLAPHGNYSFYGRGRPRHGTGMIPQSGVSGSNMGMQPVSDMGRSGGDEHGGGKVVEAIYREEAASDHQYDEVNRDRGDLPNAMREKERGLERDLPATSERTAKDYRVHEFDRYVPSEYDSEYDYEEIGNLRDREISRARSRDSNIDRERARSRDHVPDRERGWNRERQREDRDIYADNRRFTDHAPQRNDEQERGRSSRPRQYSHNGRRR